MLLCPVLLYGSPREHDLDFGSFSVLFRSIFLEGLARPRGGVRTILKQLVRRYKNLGGELKLRSGVQRIISDANRTSGVVLDDDSEIRCRCVISSAGANETEALCHPMPVGGTDTESDHGKMTFLESILTLDRQPRDFGLGDTIVFYNDSPNFDYSQPAELADLRSGIACSPNNYAYGSDGAKIDPCEGTLRLTALANYDRWTALSSAAYPQEKSHWYQKMLDSAARFLPDFRPHIVNHDVFTPVTIRRFTGHVGGAVYGTPKKRYDAKTQLDNVLICGAGSGLCRNCRNADQRHTSRKHAVAIGDGSSLSSARTQLPLHH